MYYFKSRNVKSPERGTPQSAGIDFFIPDDWEPRPVFPTGDILIPSGLHVRTPPGHALVFFNKSGVATRHKLAIGACLIDEDYQGEVHFHLFNTGAWSVHLEPGQKIAQGVLLKINYAPARELKSLGELYDEPSTRGAGGFGSTGEQ